MKPVLREDFEKMKKLGLIIETQGNKNFTITGKHKKSKRKKHYVVNRVWQDYMRALNRRKR